MTAVFEARVLPLIIYQGALSSLWSMAAAIFKPHLYLLSPRAAPIRLAVYDSNMPWIG